MRPLKPRIKVAFASGADDELNKCLIERMRRIFPELPLYVVSEFPPLEADLRWVRYDLGRGFDNLGRCRAAFRGKSIRLAGVLMVPNSPVRGMRLLALLLAPLYFLAVNENLNDFMLRPHSLPVILRHVAWRIRNFLAWHFRTGVFRRWNVRLLYPGALISGWFRAGIQASEDIALSPIESGMSVIVPFAPKQDWVCGLKAALPPQAEIIIVTNSQNGAASFAGAPPATVKLDISDEPLSFARAANRGIASAQYSHILVWNDQTRPSAGMLASLLGAFESLPDLFCASTQFRSLKSAYETDPLCDAPFPEHGAVYSLYAGSCSLYDAAKLRALGGLDPAYRFDEAPALELSYRAWRQAWPTVYVPAAARAQEARPSSRKAHSKLLVVRRHRDYVDFLVRSISARNVFRRLWREEMQRLSMVASAQPAARRLLRQAPEIARRSGRSAPPVRLREEIFLGLTDGSVSVFSGRAPTGKPRIVIVSPYLPFPLSHGGAVRMYNLARRAASDFDQILVAFTDTCEPPPAEILDVYVEIVLVRRVGTHSHPKAKIPDGVQDFDSAPFRSALRQVIAKWQAPIVQMEFTQMALYLEDCEPARTILVEHDVTLDLYHQMAEQDPDWDVRRQFELWSRFEKRAWAKVDLVVVMSDRDRAMVPQSRAVVLPNGVDLERFRKPTGKPESRRILFVGSFAHLPNLLAIEFFIREVWPLLPDARLHIIAGARHKYFLSHYRHRVDVDLERPGVEVDDFVADVRPAYERAAVVVAPLLVSAGTNLKILEAMALEKPVVSTPAGVNGLDLVPGEHFVLVYTAKEMARAIEELMDNPTECHRLGAAARRRVEAQYSWDQIARRQAEVYGELLKPGFPLSGVT